MNGGQIVEIVSEGGGWTRVRAVGHDGYVDSRFVKPNANGEIPAPSDPIPNPIEPPGTDIVTIYLPNSAAQALFDALKLKI